jgi:hypothetical protein
MPKADADSPENFSSVARAFHLKTLPKKVFQDGQKA